MTSVELFPCSGGMAEGFRRAGVVFTWAFDKSLEACDSYEANHGHRPVQMDARDLLRLARGGWRPTEALDLMVADPPCTPWSRAGKRLGVEDERDMLGQTCELIRLLRPKAYLIGNVPGLGDLTQWHHVQRALAPLRRAGYCIADYASLDAADFGVPQHRVRPFWFGHLDGPCISWPLPTHGEPSDNVQLPGTELAPWVTCREALGHLPLEQLGRLVRLRTPKQRESIHPTTKPNEPARTLTTSGGRAGKRASVVQVERFDDRPSTDVKPSRTLTGARSARTLAMNSRHMPASLGEPAPTLGEPAPTLGAKIRGQAAQVLDLAAPRPHHHIDVDRPARTQTASRQDDSRLLEWPWSLPATTVTSDDRIPPPGHHPESGSILSQPNAVVLSELAATILQGFPETWRFVAKTKTARCSMLGQAMPPPLAEAVARSVVAQMAASASKAVGA